MNPSLRRLWQKIVALWTGKAPEGRASRSRRSAARLPAAAYRLAGELRQRRLAEYVRPAWPSLTGRERQVAELLGQDLTYRQIAARLGISPGTVRAHTRLVLAKLGLRSRSELVRALGEQKIENGN